MEAVIYVNDFSETLMNTAWSSLGQSMAIGIRVAVHDAGTKPDMKTGISIGPGAETTMTLLTIHRVRLPPPFASQCTTQEYVGSSQDVKYTADACFDVCVQDQV